MSKAQRIEDLEWRLDSMHHALHDVVRMVELLQTNINVVKKGKK